MSRTTGPPTIVVIDDSQIVLSVTSALLEAAGFRVITHSRPAGCVALILQEKPELVLIDVNMPLIAGDTVAKLFGKAQPNSETVILLHSSLSAQALEAKAAACGAHGYVRKTDDGYDFVRQINNWLKRGSSGKLRAAPRYEPDDDAFSRPSGARPVARNMASSNDGPSSVNVALDSGALDPRASGTLRIASQVVLFIDDDMNALSALRRDVQREAYSVEFALSGNQGLRRILSTTPPDLVVCDLLMPDPNGMEVYRRAVAAHVRWRQRFIFTTGADHVSEVSRFLASFDGVVLAAPIHAERLRHAIRDGLALEEQALREQSSR